MVAFILGGHKCPLEVAHSDKSQKEHKLASARDQMDVHLHSNSQDYRPS